MATFDSTNTGIRFFDTTGQWQFNPDVCSGTVSNNADGTPAYLQLTDPVSGLVFRQTYTYTTGLLTSYTGWVKQ